MPALRACPQLLHSCMCEVHRLVALCPLPAVTVPLRSSTAGTCAGTCTPCSQLTCDGAECPVVQVLFNDTIMYNIR